MVGRRRAGRGLPPLADAAARGRSSAHEAELLDRLVAGLPALGGVDVLPIWPDEHRAGRRRALHRRGLRPGRVAAYLSAEHGIGVRDGRFCAHPLLARLGRADGAVRASLGVGSSREDVDGLVDALEHLLTGGRWTYAVDAGRWQPSPDPRPLDRRSRRCCRLAPRTRRAALALRELTSSARASDPVDDLRRIAFLLERTLQSSYRVKAFRSAAAALAVLAQDDVMLRAPTGRWPTLKGIGDPTATVVEEPVAGDVPDYLAARRRPRPVRWRAAGSRCGPCCAVTAPALRLVRRRVADRGDRADRAGTGTSTRR